MQNIFFGHDLSNLKAVWKQPIGTNQKLKVKTSKNISTIQRLF